MTPQTEELLNLYPLRRRERGHELRHFGIGVVLLRKGGHRREEHGEEDAESGRAWAEAFVIREVSSIPSSHRSDISLPDWLRREGVVAIDGLERFHAPLRIKIFAHPVK